MPADETDAAMTPFPDDLGTDLPLGFTPSAQGGTFRIFAPRATGVTLELFARFEDAAGEPFAMKRREGGAWEKTLRRPLAGRWYGYRIDGPRGHGEMFDPSVLVADPYSKAVTTLNHWRLPAKTLITDEGYDWGDDRRPEPSDPRELVIYECHVRDLTAHPSAGSSRPGTYAGLAERSIAGGLGHIRSLGVNAVELLPVMKFGTHEIPYRDPAARTDAGRVNDWNRYARNHWGYMTSFFFAPETYYATGGSAEEGAVNGRDGRAGRELRDLVRAFHREGIAVILDAVYNHTSHYDFNPFKYADKRYYYRLDDRGDFLEESGCGNDFNTAMPMARRAIVDSVRHWLAEYRVDGIRFDLAAMIDEETCRRITEAARGVHPGVALIAEPWGAGRHHPDWFRELGWWSWNDRFRDGVKGRDPHRGRGFIFGHPATAGDPRETLSGLLPRDRGGVPETRAVNYLESHDGFTLGDFIRIATGGETPRLSPLQLALHRLAALALFAAPGPVMLHQGQEFARSKTVADPDDPDHGRPDHNSYNKDDATNHIDFSLRRTNRDLFDYYRGLVALRRRHPGLCRPRDSSSVEMRGDGGLLSVCTIGASGRFNRYIVVLNASPDRPETVDLPAGRWCVLADASAVHPAGDGPAIEGEALLPPSSGLILGGKTSEQR